MNEKTLEWQWCRLEDLSSSDWHKIIAAREAVFVVDQQCVYQDADELDLVSWHLIGWVDRNVAAYLRVIDPGHKYNEPSIGRVLTSKQFRGKGLGKQLIVVAIERVTQVFPGRSIRISAQSYLLQFYQTFQFVPTSEEYCEEGIPHIEMLRET